MLPAMSPSIPADPFAALKGHALLNSRALSGIVRRNHITGGAFYFGSGSESAIAFTRAVHTDLVPDEKTFYRVASITKMATALLTVRLMDLGLLDPEMPVSAMVPDGAGIPELKGIRIGHLLSHTSGLADPPELEQMLNRHAPFSEAAAGCRVSKPGEKFRYSNLGFGLIGCIFEFVLSKPLGEIYHEFLFRPLGMNATLEGCSVPEEQIMPVIRIRPFSGSKAAGLRVTRLGRVPLETPDPVFHYGHTAGSMYTDLPSLVKMTICIRDGGTPLLSPKYTGYMKTQRASYGALSPTLSYGSGLLIIRDQRISSGAVYGHQGFAYGCVDGAFWEEDTGNIMISLNGGCSEARSGRLGTANSDLCRWAFREELPGWK